MFCLLALFFVVNNIAQDAEKPSFQSQEVSEKDGVPVLIKHLPNWEQKRENAALVQNIDDLRKNAGERSVFDAVEFIQGTEAVIAQYDAGKLVIVEYNTPQASIATNKKILEKLNDSDENVFYRRIGNYNVLLFDGNDETAANELFDQIKYQKVVQWLGQDITSLQQQERAFITGTMTLFIATVQIIGTGIGIALFFGIIGGLVYFRRSVNQKAESDEFSDAGGMTRLNLDGLTPDDVPDKLLDG